MSNAQASREPMKKDLGLKVLLVEDDARLAAMIDDFLSSEGFEVACEGRGDVAVGRILNETPDAVLLDVNLPGLDGFTVCKAVRPAFPGAILMLTARGDEADEVRGLEAGADDYVAKPLRPRSLVKRIMMHVRRTAAADAAAPIIVGNLVVDPSRRSVELHGATISVTTAEFDLLQLLAENAGRTVSRHEMYEQLHGVPFDSLDRSLDLRVSRVRKKLGDDPADPQLIKSVRGVGYLLPLAR